jgi:hypothetical protein
MQKIQMRLPGEGAINALTAPAKQTITERIGVKKPMLSEIEISKATTNNKGVEDIPNRFAAAIRNVAATDILRSSRAIPGAP